MSGCEAARHLNLWLKGDSKDLRGYSRSMRERWGESMAWGRRIAQVFYRFPGVGYQLGIKRPTAPRRDCIAQNIPLRGDGLWRHRPTGDQAAAAAAQLKTEAELLAAIVGLLSVCAQRVYANPTKGKTAHCADGRCWLSCWLPLSGCCGLRRRPSRCWLQPRLAEPCLR